MAALTAFTNKRYRLIKSAKNNYIVANGVTIYMGAFVGIANVSFVTTARRGYAIPWENTANIEWGGIAEPTIDITASNTVVGDTSATPPDEVSCEGGELILLSHAVTGAAAQSDVGRAVYGSNDNDLTITSNNTTRIGEIESWITSTTCHVRILGRTAWLAI